MTDLVTVDRLREQQEAFVDAIISAKGGNLPDTVENLTPILLFTSAKLKAVQALCDATSKVAGQERLNSQLLESGQKLGIALLYGQKRLGELTRPMPTASAQSNLPAAARTVTGKREALKGVGIERTAYLDAERIAAHPEVLERVIAESEGRKEIPTKTAVLREIRRESQKVTREEIDRRKAATADQARAVAPVEVQAYMSKLMKAMADLPAEPPRDGWNNALLQEARAYARIIIGRLGRFIDE